MEYLLTPAPSELAQRVTRYADQAEYLWNLFAKFGRIFANVSLEVATAAAVAPLSLLAGLDPILVTAIGDEACRREESSLHSWYYVTHWFNPT